HIRVGASAQAASKFASYVEFDVGITHKQSLSIGVNGDELYALETDFDHSIDCVYTATADSDDFNDREVILWSCHVPLPLLDVLHVYDSSQKPSPLALRFRICQAIAIRNAMSRMVFLQRPPRRVAYSKLSFQNFLAYWSSRAQRVTT